MMIPDPKPQPPTTEPEEGTLHVFDAVFEDGTACALGRAGNIVFDGTPTVGTNGLPAWHDAPATEEK